MKYLNIKLSRKRFFQSEVIEVHPLLTDKFGSKFNLSSDEPSHDEKMNFQLDRLFSVIHDN